MICSYSVRTVGVALGCAVLSLILSGCASISVISDKDERTTFAPRKVYVESFRTSGTFRVDRDGQELVDFKKNLQLLMKTAISVDLTKRLIPATTTDRVSPTLSEHAWLIRGDFVRVNQGSRLLRGAVGFGLGATKLICHVRVYDLSYSVGEPFLTFTTTGGSNAEPGAITSIATDPLTIAVEAVTGGAGNVAHGLTEDTNRTAREITAELSDYMYHRNWISKDKWVEPKHYTE